MQIITDLHRARLRRPLALTIGNFDGLHRGHRELLRALQAVGAGENGSDGLATGLLTFDPHPLAVLRPHQPPTLLTTPLERLHLAAQQGIDVGVIYPFTHATAEQDPATFLGELTAALNLAVLVVGPDFALGRHRSGDLDVLAELGQRLGYRLVIIEPVTWHDRAVRSSNIRHLLAQGNVEEAAHLLGRLYHVTGPVVLGDQRGRTIGVPTANLLPPADKLWPADGVYATRTWIHGGDPAAARPIPSVTNLGVRPTVDGHHHRFETHLIDWAPANPGEDLYGRTVTVEFVQRLRGEQRFAGLAELVAQIQQDIAAARAVPGVTPADPFSAATPFFLERQFA